MSYGYKGAVRELSEAIRKDLETYEMKEIEKLCKFIPRLSVPVLISPLVRDARLVIVRFRDISFSIHTTADTGIYACRYECELIVLPGSIVLDEGKTDD